MPWDAEWMHREAASHLGMSMGDMSVYMGNVPRSSILSCMLEGIGLTAMQDVERALMDRPHKVLGVQDGIQRLNLQ